MLKEEVVYIFYIRIKKAVIWFWWLLHNLHRIVSLRLFEVVWLHTIQNTNRIYMLIYSERKSTRALRVCL